MPRNVDADQSEQISQLYAELLQLFQEARQLQTQSAYLLAVAHQACADSPGTPAGAEPHAPADDNAPLSPEETLDSMITLLAAFSFHTQVSIVKALALGMASAARARADIKHPSTA